MRVAVDKLLSYLKGLTLGLSLRSHLHLAVVGATHALVLLGGVATQGSRAAVDLGTVGALEIFSALLD